MADKKIKTENQQEKTVKSYVVVLLTFLMTFTISMLGLHSWDDSYYHSQRKEAYDMAKEYVEPLENEAGQVAVETVRMANMVVMNPNMTNWFNKSAKDVEDKHSAFLGAELTRYQVNSAGVKNPGDNKNLVVAAQDYPAKFSIKGDKGLWEAYRHITEDMVDGDGEPKVVGPVEMENGDLAMLTITPVYLYNNRTQDFDQWGTVSVALKLPDAIADAKLDTLKDQGYVYALYGNNPNMENDGYIIGSGEELPENSESASIVVPQDLWLLKLAPAGGFGSMFTVEVAIAVSAVFSLLISGSVMHFLRR